MHSKAEKNLVLSYEQLCSPLYKRWTNGWDGKYSKYSEKYERARCPSTVSWKALKIIEKVREGALPFHGINLWLLIDVFFIFGGEG